MQGTSRTLPYTIKSVGLLGSHAFGSNPRFMAIAVSLGRELVKQNIKLVYGGGFIPGYIALRRVYGHTYGVEHIVSSNYYKYFEMNHAVEAFIILSGGVEAIEGLFTLISRASEGLHSKPIGLLNIDGYFNNLLKFLDDANTRIDNPPYESCGLRTNPTVNCRVGDIRSGSRTAANGSGTLHGRASAVRYLGTVTHGIAYRLGVPCMPKVWFASGGTCTWKTYLAHQNGYGVRHSRPTQLRSPHSQLSLRVYLKENGEGMRELASPFIGKMKKKENKV
ncbi:hypothetical protein DM860_011179 [Cuscuta australis]|uniref:cytokinin riboside 5'-monophosphate phosphoribohydrolase n=1 Tax=Cuscuta australis TaxID=267555 RepID=A0A328DE91_9ASTE|nr:hypothetical protein DM860_011179 [Cuscuta australis]